MTEFGRRVRDNGSGTDHGAAGATFVLGDKVKGGQLVFDKVIKAKTS